MQAVTFFKALSDPTRLNLVIHLRNTASMCVCDLTQVLQQPQPTVSRHLNHLKRAGILINERRGNWMWYGLNSDMPTWCMQVINSIEMDDNEDINFERNKNNVNNIEPVAGED